MPRSPFSDLEESVHTVADVSFPTRMTVCAGCVVTAGFGCEQMYLSTLPLMYIVVIVTASLLSAAFFVMVWYLKDYEDWKASKNLAYVNGLVTDPEKTIQNRPNTIFGPAYKFAMGGCVLAAVIISAVVTPVIAEKFVSSPAMLTLEYYAMISVLCTMVLAFVFDREVARPIADKSMKAKFNAVEEDLARELELKFQSDKANQANKEALTFAGLSPDQLMSMKAWFNAMPDMPKTKE